MKRVALALLAGLFLLLVAAWLAVSAPFLGQFRAGLAQRALDASGSNVKIEGPLNVDLGKQVHFSAENIGIGDGQGVVRMAKVEADLPLADLLHRLIDPSNIVVTGTSVTLVRDPQGNLIGLEKHAPTDAPGKTLTPDTVLAALGGKSVRLVDTRVSLQDQASNFTFDAKWDELDLLGDSSSGTIDLKGQGTLNGQPMAVSASVPKNAPIMANLTSGATTLSFTGAEGSSGLDGGIHGQFSAESTDLSQTLALLQLMPVLKGNASAKATLGQAAGGDLSLTGIDVAATLDSGQSAQISGSIGNLRELDDAQIAIDLLAYPEGKEPPPAQLWKDLRLTSVKMELSGPLKGQTHRSMSIATNGFKINTAGIGPAPIQLKQISRGAGGELIIGSASLQVGPAGAPWLTAEGSIGNLLQLSGVAIDGKLALPISTIVGAGNKKLPAELGSFSGAFKLSGAIEALSLTDIKIATQDSDLWSLGMTGSIGSLLPLEGVDLKMDTSIKTAAMLKVLGKTPVNLAPLEFHSKLASVDKSGTIAVQLAMIMAESNLSLDLTANNRGVGPVLRGTATSNQIRMADLQQGLNAAKEIAAAFRGNAPTSAASTRPQTRSRKAASQDDVEGISIQMVDEDRILRYGEMDIKIKIDKFAGKTMTKGIDAQLVVKNGKASLGPLKFAYDKNQFDIEASIDAIKAPKILHLKGSTTGWNLADIMKSLRVKYAATGTIDANFNISGDRTSLAKFMNTLDGTATLHMKNGSIATSLLDLAGLGVVPWLFSKDRKDKFAAITCLRAPMEFKNGVVSSKEAVVETPEVQLVAFGSINIPQRTINVAGQPRPVGKPLTRSPWPFTLSGSLTKPKLKVKDGPSRLRRVDGANKMPAKRVACVPDILQLK